MASSPVNSRPARVSVFNSAFHGISDYKPVPIRFRNIILVVTCLAYAATRFWRLADTCLWFDEIFSVHAATHPWGDLLSFVALDLIHPPLFYVALKLWISIGGEGLFWLRLLPVIFSIIAIFPVIALCRELKLNFWAQALALFLVAINGSPIKYAQEVRMYSLLMCLSLFSMWLFARYFTKGKNLWPLVIVNVLMVYTHYFGWFVVLSEVVLIVWFQRIKWRRIAVMLGITIVSFLPWLIAVFMAARSGSGLEQNIGWMSRPGIRQIVTFVFNIIEPFYFQTSTVEPISIFRITVPILLILAVAAVLYLVNWRKLSEHERRHVYLLLVFIKLPVVITFLASWLLPYSLWGTRHLIVVFAPFCICAAILLTSRSVKWLPAAAATLVVLLAGYGFVIRAVFESPKNSWCVWEPLVEEMVLMPSDSSEPGTINAFEQLVGYHVWFAARNFPDIRVNVVKDFPGTKEDAAYFIPRGFDEVKLLAPESAFSGPELWIAFRDRDPGHDTPGVSMISNPPKILSEMKYLGYEAVDTKKIRAGSESAYLVKMVRRSQE